jgi:hypothetical protein
MGRSWETGEGAMTALVYYTQGCWSRTANDPTSPRICALRLPAWGWPAWPVLAGRDRRGGACVQVSVVMDQFLRLLHHAGMPPADADLLHCDGPTMNHLLLQVSPPPLPPPEHASRQAAPSASLCWPDSWCPCCACPALLCPRVCLLLMVGRVGAGRPAQHLVHGQQCGGGAAGAGPARAAARGGRGL